MFIKPFLVLLVFIASIPFTYTYVHNTYCGENNSVDIIFSKLWVIFIFSYCHNIIIKQSILSIMEVTLWGLSYMITMDGTNYFNHYSFAKIDPVNLESYLVCNLSLCCKALTIIWSHCIFINSVPIKRNIFNHIFLECKKKFLFILS